MLLFQITSAASEQDTTGPERQGSGYHLFTTLLQLELGLGLECDIKKIKKKVSCCFVIIPVKLNTPDANAAIFAWGLSTQSPSSSDGWRW